MAFTDFTKKVEELGQKRPCQDFISDMRYGYEEKKEEAAAKRKRKQMADQEQEQEQDNELHEGDGMGKWLHNEMLAVLGK